MQQSQVNAQVNAPQENLKLPTFWKHNAEGWITLIETKFRLSRIDAQVNRYVAVLEAFDASNLERPYDFPNPEDAACYEKLITQIRTVFAGDENERLDLLLKDLTLGDRSPNELTRNLIAAAGTDNVCSPQFEEILKDKFLKALPHDIAANSGNWNYNDLRTLANCATQAINASKRYGRDSNSVLATDCVTKLANDKPFASAESENWNPHNRPHTHSNGRQTQRYFPQNNFSRSRSNMAQQHPNFNRNLSQPRYKQFTFYARPVSFQRGGYSTPRFGNFHQFQQPRPALPRQFEYICLYHRCFRQNSYSCKGLHCKYFQQLQRNNALNRRGRQLQSTN